MREICITQCEHKYLYIFNIHCRRPPCTTSNTPLSSEPSMASLTASAMPLVKKEPCREHSRSFSAGKCVLDANRVSSACSCHSGCSGPTCSRSVPRTPYTPTDTTVSEGGARASSSARAELGGCFGSFRSPCLDLRWKSSARVSRCGQAVRSIALLASARAKSVKMGQ